MTKAAREGATMLLGTALASCGRFTLAQSAFGQVEGQVTCNDGNVPARGASVQLIPLASLLPGEPSGGGSSQDSPTTRSDLTGFYALASVELGAYIVDATMAGYEDDLTLVRTTLSRYTPDQQNSMLAAFPQVNIKAGASMHQDLILRRAGAISGSRLVDVGGTISQSQVTATLVVDPASEGPAGPLSFLRSAVTDDRGVYRIAGLPPGNYRVSVRVVENFFGTILGGPQKLTVAPQRTGLADLTVFVPEGLSLSDAKQVKLADGDELSAVDITVPTRLLHSLAGTVTRGGEPVAAVSLSLETEGNRVTVSDALSMADGSFRFDLLPDGNYTIVASTYSLGKATNSTRLPVQLHGNDVTELMLSLPMDKAKQ